MFNFFFLMISLSVEKSDKYKYFCFIFQRVYHLSNTEDPYLTKNNTSLTKEVDVLTVILFIYLENNR